LSRIAHYLWWLLPAVRKRKDKDQSVLFGLLLAIGSVLDELKTTILTARLRRYFLIRTEDDPYYSSDQRSLDLDMHALDRGLRRLPGESDEALLARISTLAYRNRFLGTKAGIAAFCERGAREWICQRSIQYTPRARITLRSNAKR